MAASTTSATEAAFAAALRNRTAPVPAGVLGTPRRFAVYRGNVAAALTGALAARFPIIERIVGQAFFQPMAQAYARENPPRRACLLDYGDRLPAFLAGFEPARSLPYLPDMARLEIARSQAYHAKDAPVIAAQDLACLDPACLFGVTVTPHPAARLLASSHPVATIAAMHAPGEEPGPIDPWVGEAVLVTRPQLVVTTAILAPGEHACLAALLAGAPLGEAVAAGLGADGGFDPARGLAVLVTSGAVEALHPELRA
jgi:Putative DNA-binding domain